MVAVTVPLNPVRILLREVLQAQCETLVSNIRILHSIAVFQDTFLVDHKTAVNQ